MGLGEMLGGDLGQVYVEVRGELSKLRGDFAEAFAATETEAQSFGQRVGAMLTPKNVMVLGGAMTAIGAPLEHLGNQLEQSEKQLQAAAEAAGLSEEDLKSHTQGLIGKMENLNHTEAQTNEALRQFVQAGRPAEELNKDMAIAADLAAAKHMSLSAAAGLIAKVYGGNSKVLKQFGIDVKALEDPQKALTTAQDDATKAAAELDKATESNRLAHMRYAEQTKHTAVQNEELKNSDDALRKAHEQVTITADNLKKAQEGVADGHTKAGAAIDLLAEKLHGQAAASVDTFGGKLEVIKTHLLDIAAHVGSKVGPALMMLGPLLMTAGGAMQLFSSFSAASAVTSATAGEAAAVSSGGFMAMAASVWAAMAPILPIIALLAALGAAGYLLYRNWDTVWAFVKNITGDAVGWVRDHLHLIEYALGGPLAPLFLLMNNWRTVWNDIRNVIGDVVGWIERQVGRVVGAVDRIGNALSHIPGAGLVGGVGHLLGFATGGTVPGPVGKARLAVVHGGEEVRPYGAGGGDTGGGGGWSGDLIIQGSVIAERELTGIVRDTVSDVVRYNGSTGWGKR